jgi:hypothetical protein
MIVVLRVGSDDLLSTAAPIRALHTARPDVSVALVTRDETIPIVSTPHHTATDPPYPLDPHECHRYLRLVGYWALRHPSGSTKVRRHTW